jgi:HlyD family type I secretion membrane fusion protein
MSNDKNSQAKPQLSQEQIKQLMAMMQSQKPQPKYRQYLQKIASEGMKLAQALTIHMDNFVKFVVKKDDSDRNDVVQNARGPILFGTYVIIIFVVIGGFWSAFAPLDTAAVALGTVIPSTKRKIIQHPTGGIIKEIYVQVGDHVKEGDPILELDEVNAKTQYETSLNYYRTYLAGYNRLVAERDDLKEIEFDQFLLNSKDNPKVASIMKTETELFQSREEAYRKRIESLEQKHLQVEKQLEGLKARRVSALKSKEVMKDRLIASKNLYDKGIINRAAYLEVESREAQADSDLAATEAEIARINQAILQDDAEILTYKNQYVSDIMENLNKHQSAANEAREKYLMSKDSLERTVLKSPVDGTIIEMLPTTIGGVVNGSYPIAEILPTNDKLIIEARVSSKNIDSVTVGLKAKIRFSAFKSRTSPIFNGVVTALSPDIIQEKQQMPMQQDGPTYLAKIEIDMDDFNKLAKKGKLTLKPGMQAEVQIVTGTRTLLRYLLDPITDNMFKAFKEK